MITSIVMIKCEIGKANAVAEKIVDLEGVAEVYSVTGEWDIFAVIRVKQFDSLSGVVTEGIAKISGVTKTLTNMAFRCYSKHDMEKMWGEYIGE